MRTSLVAGNWKMNGTREGARRLVAEVLDGLHGGGCEVALCPPHVLLDVVGTELLAGASARVALGAQDVSEHACGAYTGEVAATMLAEAGCRYVIVGHSERRTLHRESDALIARKFAASQAAGLTPILCVGEQLAEREAGATETVVARQLDAVLDGVGVVGFTSAVVAYEPVWAIGTGKTASPDQAQAVHAFIRARVAAHDATLAAAVRILYGGSVKAANAAELMVQPDIDGGLIGGASLDAGEFLTICRAGSL